METTTAETANTVNKIKKLPRKVVILIEMIFLVVIIIVFVIVNKNISEKQILVSTNTVDYKYMIDSVSIREDKLHIEGWCYKLGDETPELDSEESRAFKIYLLKSDYDVRSLEGLSIQSAAMDTVRVERPDVQTVYGPQEANRNVLNCGFEADIAYDSKYVEDYLIAFKYGDEGGKVLNTGVYVKDRINGTE